MKEKVLDGEKYLEYFISLTWVPGFSPLLVVVFLVFPPTSLFPLLFPCVILNKVGKKERGIGRMEVDWYRTRVFVEKMPKIKEEIPIS